MSAGRRLDTVVLAAGEGTRMRSGLPKVLHPLCGRPMLVHVLSTLGELPGSRVVVVVGHGGGEVSAAVRAFAPDDERFTIAEQAVQRGTGDAVHVALGAFPDDLDTDADGDLLVVLGDVPLLRADTLARLVAAHRAADGAGAVLTARLADPTGYGRVVRDDRGVVARIVEHADASDDERAVDEVNTSIYCFRRSMLAPALRRLSPENAKGEYYLTDVVAVLRQAGHEVIAVEVEDSTEALGVNDRAQLAEAEHVLRRRINDQWMRAGVTMVDPERTYVDVTVQLAADVCLLPGTMLQGTTRVAAGAVIGPDCQIVDSVVGDRAVVRQSVARGVEIGPDVTVGPYASLRPGTRLDDGAHVGTFVEIKASVVGPGAKVPHLSYVGDAEIGADANLGAGTITANYDGRVKHPTRVGAGAHTGSNTVLVAPVDVGDGAYTGAGAVVTRDVPDGALARGVPARIEEGWASKREDTDESGS